MKARIFGEKNNNWKGDAVGYNQLHAYMRLRIPRPLLCECGLKAPHDLANKGIYNRDIHNWEWLCRKCHLTKDGRLGKLLKYARSSKTTGFALVNKNKTHCLRGHPFCGYNQLHAYMRLRIPRPLLCECGLKAHSHNKGLGILS